MCDVTNYKSYGLGLAAANEVRKYIVYIIDNIIVFFYQWLYKIMRPVDL